jgi:hypothetical protein
VSRTSVKCRDLWKSQLRASRPDLGQANKVWEREVDDLRVGVKDLIEECKGECTTVQGGFFQPLCRGLNIESLAEWPKSGKESG